MNWLLDLYYSSRKYDTKEANFQFWNGMVKPWS